VLKYDTKLSPITNTLIAICNTPTIKKYYLPKNLLLICDFTPIKQIFFQLEIQIFNEKLIRRNNPI